MTLRILFELQNITLSHGTGIATYARNLVHTASELGYETGGLLHSCGHVNSKDRTLAQIDLFDARNRSISRFTRLVTMNLRRGVGLPFGLPISPLSLGQIVQDDANRVFGGLKHAYAATLFNDLARFHFKRYGVCAKLRVPDKPQIFHATQAIPLAVPGAKNIYTIHDLVPLRLPHTTLDDKKYFYDMVRHLSRVADRIVTVSEASREDIISLAGAPPEKVVNTYQAVSLPDELVNLSESEAAQLVEGTFGLKYKNYFLFYGAIEPKKNISRIVDAYIASGSTRQLVIAGALGWEYENDMRKIQRNKSRRYVIDGNRIVQDLRIRRLEYLPLFQLVALIRGSRAVLFPSIFEGFGLPVLESMLLGAPVLTSSGSALKEVAGDAALLVEPTDVMDIMRGIQKLDTDDELCAELSAKGVIQAAKFSKAAYAARIKKLYEDVLSEP